MRLREHRHASTSIRQTCSCHPRRVPEATSKQCKRKMITSEFNLSCVAPELVRARDGWFGKNAYVICKPRYRGDSTPSSSTVTDLQSVMLLTSKEMINIVLADHRF